MSDIDINEVHLGGSETQSPEILAVLKKSVSQRLERGIKDSMGIKNKLREAKAN